jgi:hypothetical protein
MTWYHILALVGGVLCGIAGLIILASLTESKLARYSSRFAAAVFVLLAYCAIQKVLPLGPKHWALVWAFPALLAVLGIVNLIQVIRNRDEELTAFLKQNGLVLLAVALLVGGRLLIGLSGL